MQTHRFIDPCEMTEASAIMVQVWVEKETHPSALNWVRTHCGERRIRKPKDADGRTIMHLPQVQVAVPDLEEDLEKIGFNLVHAYGALREDNHGITIENKGAITLVFRTEGDPVDLYDPEFEGVSTLFGELEDKHPLTFNAAYGWSNPNGVVTIQLDGADLSAPVPGLTVLRLTEDTLYLEQKFDVTVSDHGIEATRLSSPISVAPIEAHQLTELMRRHTAA